MLLYNKSVLVKFSTRDLISLSLYEKLSGRSTFKKKKKVLYDFQTYTGTIIPVYCLMLVFWQNILSSWSNVPESTTNSLQKTKFVWTANSLLFFDASVMEIYWASLHLKQPLVFICSVLLTTLFSLLLSQIWSSWLTVFQSSSKHYILL